MSTTVHNHPWRVVIEPGATAGTVEVYPAQGGLFMGAFMEKFHVDIIGYTLVRVPGRIARFCGATFDRRLEKAKRKAERRVLAIEREIACDHKLRSTVETAVARNCTGREEAL